MHLIKALAKPQGQMHYEIDSKRGSAISSRQLRPSSVPRCACVRTAVGHPWPPQRCSAQPWPRLSLQEEPALIRCAIRQPQTQIYQRTATANAVIGVGYASQTDNIPWPFAPLAPPADGPRPTAMPGTGTGTGTGTGALVGWLAAIPRSVGAHLFVLGDAEAGWRGWQVTSMHAGLGRRYRDPLFTTRQPT